MGKTTRGSGIFVVAPGSVEASSPPTSMESGTRDELTIHPQVHIEFAVIEILTNLKDPASRGCFFLCGFVSRSGPQNSTPSGWLRVGQLLFSLLSIAHSQRPSILMHSRCLLCVTVIEGVLDLCLSLRSKQLHHASDVHY